MDSVIFNTSFILQIWQIPKNEHVTIGPREQVLTPVRVVSMLAEQLSKNAEQDDNQVQILDLEREVSIRPQLTGHQGHPYGQC